ncbi:MAG: aldolase/citrate lyase family protein [Opitutaceae bacterium]|nr:aldolase/citrate lyase family protein [Opitutaceae bacterium]
MTPSFVRAKLATSEPILTAKACYADPELVELMASAGFDAVWLCLEHRRLDPAVVYSLIQACRLGGADTLVRIKPANHADVLWLLESGTRGIMLPRVRHPDEVRSVVAAMKFFPEGNRGSDVIHADSSFGRVKLGDYVAAANRETFLVVQIEEPEVVPHLDAIAAMPGVDVLFVGPGDLTLGLGQTGPLDGPEVMKIVSAVADACRRHGKRAGIPCAADQVAKYRALGYSFFNVVSDYRCVVNGLKSALAAARA